MKYFDYYRTWGEDVDVALRRFLLTIHDQDTLRRIRVAFPEYFTDERHSVITGVQLRDIALRYKHLKADPDFEDEGAELLTATFDWFGLKLYSHEYRTDGKKYDGSEILPQDFKRERGAGYNGLTDHDPWVVTLVTEDCPEGQEHLVIEVQVTGDTSPEYFIWTIPTDNISF